MTAFGVQILVIEDDHDIRQAFADVLAVLGYTVRCVADGREALDYLAAHPAPCLIFLDLMMPGMDGFEFRARQRHTPALAAIPVVVLSADGKVEDRAREIEASGWLRKPIEFEALHEALRRWCGPEAAAAPARDAPVDTLRPPA